MTDRPPGEPCMGCGRDTATGTRLFADRRTTRTEGGAIFLCADCNERAVSHYGRRLTETDMVQLSARAAGFGFGGAGGGAFPAGGGGG